MDLFDGNGKPLGIYDVCKWWVERYPEDVFPITERGGHIVAVIREEMKKIIEKESG